MSKGGNMIRNRISNLASCAGIAAIGALVLATAIPASNAVLPRPFFTMAGATKTREGLALSRASFHAMQSSRFPAAGAGRVRVVVESDAPVAARTAIEAAGGRVERSWRNLVQAVVPRSAVAALERQPSVDLARAPMRARPDAVAGEEVGASLAAAWHAKGFTGKSVKIEIIDAGFKGLGDRQAAGDLPANVVTQDFCGGQFGADEDHGTAVAEIVHEMAPD